MRVSRKPVKPTPPPDHEARRNGIGFIVDFYLRGSYQRDMADARLCVPVHTLGEVEWLLRRVEKRLNRILGGKDYILSDDQQSFAREGNKASFDPIGRWMQMLCVVVEKKGKKHPWFAGYDVVFYNTFF
jgi:hypothetical protein